MRPRLILLVFVGIILAGCGYTPATKSEASTSKYELLDVTSAGRPKSGRTTESYWLDTSTNIIYRCFHDRNSFGNNLTLHPTECEKFPRPGFLSATSTLLAINMGAGQKTQSVWKSDSGSMSICEHNGNFWGGQTESAESCQTFDLPSQLVNGSYLATMNSGSGIPAQSFWINPDSTMTACTHQKDKGFLGLGSGRFGEIVECTPFDMPPNFPSDVIRPELRGITSDSSRPWESFWQDANGVLVRCKHIRISNLFSNDQIGASEFCEYWWAPKSEDLFRN